MIFGFEQGGIIVIVLIIIITIIITTSVFTMSGTVVTLYIY